MPGKIKDMTGERYGQLEVIGFSHRDEEKNRTFWRVLCHACGKESVKSRGNLRGRGGMKSCGCQAFSHRERKQFKYGEQIKGHPHYTLWHNIRQRCRNPKSSGYDRYGGAGVTICDEWYDNPWAFFNYVEEHLGKKPRINHTIDRIENDRGYEPGNIRWASPKEQANNRKTNRLVDFQGEKYTMKQLSELTGIPVTTLHWRRKQGNPLVKPDEF